MVGVGDIKTAVDWITSFFSTTAGTATVDSHTAHWRPHDGSVFYEFDRRLALHVMAYRVGFDGTPEAGDFDVQVGLEGRFSKGQQPPEISDAKFYVGDANTGDGTGLHIKFEAQDGEVRQWDGDWAIPFLCEGTLNIRHDVTVQFRAGMLVTTEGHIHLEAPMATPGSGQSILIDRELAPDGVWQWEATFAPDASGVPTLWVVFVSRLVQEMAR